jgi:ribosomal protein S18 acetylase RimI-like enzyme
MIEYRETIDEISPEQLSGFFVGWPNCPSAETHLRILKGSHAVILAIETTSQRVVGFVTAISDGILSAYMPLLEVLPEFQNQGIGSELVQRMLKRLSSLYMVDVVCDPKLQSFYERFGLKPRVGMVLRNYENQAGF